MYPVLRFSIFIFPGVSGNKGHWVTPWNTKDRNVENQDVLISMMIRGFPSYINGPLSFLGTIKIFVVSDEPVKSE